MMQMVVLSNLTMEKSMVVEIWNTNTTASTELYIHMATMAMFNILSLLNTLLITIIVIC